jgi:hypothetical protein
MVGRLVTVGVYGFTAERFLAALKRADVGVLFDVRQRRGVRGAEYAWANSQRLQQALADCDIGYLHLKELAPTSEIRAAQYAAARDIRPPHVEDVFVKFHGARHVDTIQSLGAFLQTRVTVWTMTLFDGTLLQTGSGTGYVPIDGPFPSCSTGYWRPEQCLDFDGDSRYVFRADGGRRRIRYVGRPRQQLGSNPERS